MLTDNCSLLGHEMSDRNNGIPYSFNHTRYQAPMIFIHVTEENLGIKAPDIISCLLPQDC